MIPEELQRKIEKLIDEHYRQAQRLLNNLTSLIYEYQKETATKPI